MLRIVQCRLQLKMLQRYYSRNSTIEGFNEMNVEILLSEENRQRCLAKMNKMPEAQIKGPGSKCETKSAAVLIAICTDDQLQNPALLYTRRSRLLRRHMGQISFPGGIRDDNEDFIQCALRETYEEIGLPPDRVKLWGTGSLLKPANTAAIMPVIGVVNNFERNQLNLNAAEVEEVFIVPINTLRDPRTCHYTQFRNGFSIPVFLTNEIRIWGITGFLTHIFLKCILPEQLYKANHGWSRLQYVNKKGYILNEAFQCSKPHLLFVLLSYSYVHVKLYCPCIVHPLLVHISQCKK